MSQTSRSKSTKILGDQHLAVLPDGDADPLPPVVTGQDILPMAGARHPLPDYGGGKLLLRLPGSHCLPLSVHDGAGEMIIGNVFSPQIGSNAKEEARSDGAFESGPPVTLDKIAAFRIDVGEKVPRRHILAVIAGDLLQGLAPCQRWQPCILPLLVDQVMDSHFQPGNIDGGLSTGARFITSRSARDWSGQPAEAEQHKKYWNTNCFFSHGGLGDAVS